MKKAYSIILSLLLIFTLSGITYAQNTTDTFNITKANIKAGKKLPNTMTNNGITIKYPENWQEKPDSQFDIALVQKATGTNTFTANLNIASGKSEKEIQNLSAEELKHALLRGFANNDNTRVTFSEAQKTKWNKKTAFFIEIDNNIQGFTMKMIQCWLVGEKRTVIFTFAMDKDTFDKGGKEVFKNIFSSLQFDENYI